jgi:hypothetical protein
MIQRKQTIFLLVAFVAMLVCALMPVGVPYVWLVAVVAALGSMGDIFLYTRRPLQARICIGLIGLSIIYYMAVAVYQHSIGGELVFTWPLALPALAIVFWFMAYKGIVKDEKLVRSLDRIR